MSADQLLKAGHMSTESPTETPPPLAFVASLQAGQRFGRYQVIEITRQRGRPMVLCRCDCGTERLVAPSNLKSGNSRSCGCLKSEVTTRSTRHGYAGTSIYMTWGDMLNRCTNRTHKRWADYGGRGITVCERWRDFANFLADMGDRPPGMTLDRVDNDRGYEPSNCRWTTQSEQNRNRRPMPRQDACQQGHPYTDDNTRITSRGARQCRACAREYARQARIRRNQKTSGA